MTTHAIVRFAPLLLALTLCLAASCPAIEYQQLSAAKRLTAEKRYDEAIQKLQAVAAKTGDGGENYSYLAHAIDIAVKSLKDADRALALAGEIKDPAYRDFARLDVLVEFRRYDEALAFVTGKDVDTWPMRCRGQAHGILAQIYHHKKDDTAELEQWQLAAKAPGAELGGRGRAFREAGVIHLKRGETAKAEEQFRQAISLTPSGFAWRTESLIALSTLLIQNQRAKEAVKLFEGTDFTKIENINSKGSLLEARARALLAAGKKIKAIETFDQILQLNVPAVWKDRINTELDRMAEDL